MGKIKVNNVQLREFRAHFKVLKDRIETEHSNISHSDMLRILSKQTIANWDRIYENKNKCNLIAIYSIY